MTKKRKLFPEQLEPLNIIEVNRAYEEWVDEDDGTDDYPTIGEVMAVRFGTLKPNYIQDPDPNVPRGRVIIADHDHNVYSDSTGVLGIAGHCGLCNAEIGPHNQSFHNIPNSCIIYLRQQIEALQSLNSSTTFDREGMTS